jgi:hypothetical protein
MHQYGAGLRTKMVPRRRARRGSLDLHQNGEFDKAVKTNTSWPYACESVLAQLARVGTQTALLTLYFL